MFYDNTVIKISAENEHCERFLTEVLVSKRRSYYFRKIFERIRLRIKKKMIYISEKIDLKDKEYKTRNDLSDNEKQDIENDAVLKNSFRELFYISSARIN